ncbi:MAG TPA: hypothetical protein VFL57_09065 [Bryobacteraceae bacterium]|nr:hypothetical protein [Bryobacteraceae bacterium]
MDECEQAAAGMKAIQQLRERVKELKELVLRASKPAAAPAADPDVQQTRQRDSAMYIEIRPRSTQR